MCSYHHTHAHTHTHLHMSHTYTSLYLGLLTHLTLPLTPSHPHTLTHSVQSIIEVPMCSKHLSDHVVELAVYGEDSAHEVTHS